MVLSAVTVFGADRPGVIADVAGAIAEHGANIQDSTMTLLGDHVAMMLLVSGRFAEEELRARCPDLVVAVVPVGAAGVPARRGPSRGAHFVLSVHGPDRPGIMSAVTSLLVRAGGSITGMSSRLSGRIYVMIADVTLGEDVDVSELMRRLSAVGAELGSEINFWPAAPEAR